MDIIGPATFLTDLIGRIAGARSNRPRLGVKIIAFRPDVQRARLVFRASVLNYGHPRAMDCEAFWTVFHPNLAELSSGTAVFWSPATDDDYDFVNRETTSLAIDYNSRRFCWAEVDVSSAPVEGFGVRMFPYDCPAGLYSFAIVVEYGRYKSFDFVGLEIPDRISPSVPAEQAIESLHIRRGYRGRWGLPLRARKIRTFIAKTDYHNYVRPT